jgi:hypothetical protein
MHQPLQSTHRFAKGLFAKLAPYMSSFVQKATKQHLQKKSRCVFTNEVGKGWE